MTHYILSWILLAPPLLLALTFHEFSHGFVAYLLGDPTPKYAGRLSLNPLKHLDFFGTLTLFLTQAIGWAKPVPINPNYFKNPWKGMALVALAGPMANFLLAFIMGFLANLFYVLPLSLGNLKETLTLMAYLGVKINIGLGVFNLLPIPPLDGSKILAKFLPWDLRASYMRAELIGFLIILFLALTGVLSYIIYPPLNFLTHLVLNLTSF